VPATRRGDGYDYFQRTILDGIKREFYSNYSSINCGDTARIWGLTSSLKGSWETIDTDDWFLFYTRQNEYEYAAQVLRKEQNPELGDAIREKVLDAPKNTNRDWDFIVFLDSPISVSAAGEEVAMLFDYSNTFPVRFIRVTQKRMNSLKDKHGRINKFIDTIKQ